MLSIKNMACYIGVEMGEISWMWIVAGAETSHTAVNTHLINFNWLEIKLFDVRNIANSTGGWYWNINAHIG